MKILEPTVKVHCIGQTTVRARCGLDQRWLVGRKFLLSISVAFLLIVEGGI